MKGLKKIIVDSISLATPNGTTYLLMMQVEKDTKKIPIIVGASEAQAIAFELENILPERPLTHDLFFSLAVECMIDFKYVVIDSFKEGIFYAKICISHNKKDIKIDARPSDAIAIALRFHIDIFTTKEIIEATGIDDEINEEKIIDEKTSSDNKKSLKSKISTLSEEKLESLLKEYIENENYEQAALIRDEIKKRH